jgi:hypothetical protein
MDANELYGGSYLNVEMARTEKLLNKWIEISNVKRGEFDEVDDKTEKTKTVKKLVLEFKDIDYELPLNKTNGRTMIKDYGGETDNWIGQKIKFRVQAWATGDGIVIKSKKELEDEGETIPTPSSSSKSVEEAEAEAVDMTDKPEVDVNNVKGISEVLDKVISAIEEKEGKITTNQVLRAADNLLGTQAIDLDTFKEIKKALGLNVK